MATIDIRRGTDSSGGSNMSGWAAAIQVIGEGVNRGMDKSAQRRQMRFQANQSSTSYQRAVADMKAAGLNPMLAFDQGGASTPPGAGSSGVGTTAVASTAIQALRNDAEVKLMNAQQENTETDTNLKTKQGYLVGAQAHKTEEETTGIIAEAKILDAAVTRARQQQELYTGTQGAVRSNIEWLREQFLGKSSAVQPIRTQKPIPRGARP